MGNGPKSSRNRRFDCLPSRWLVHVTAWKTCNRTNRGAVRDVTQWEEARIKPDRYRRFLPSPLILRISLLPRSNVSLTADSLFCASLSLARCSHLDITDVNISHPRIIVHFLASYLLEAEKRNSRDGSGRDTRKSGRAIEQVEGLKAFGWISSVGRLNITRNLFQSDSSTAHRRVRHGRYICNDCVGYFRDWREY